MGNVKSTKMADDGNNHDGSGFVDSDEEFGVKMVQDEKQKTRSMVISSVLGKGIARWLFLLVVVSSTTPTVWATTSTAMVESPTTTTGRRSLSYTYDWAIKAGGSSDNENDNTENYGVAHGDGKVFAIGEFMGTATFGGTSLTSSGDKDVFLSAQHASNGAHIWAVKAGGSSDDEGWGVAYGDGKVFAAGKFRGTATFGGTSLTSPHWGGFVTALNPLNGLYLWAVEAGFDCQGVAYGNGKVFAIGAFSGTRTFGGKSLTSTGMNDVFLTAQNATNGAYLWAVKVGGSNNDYGYGVAYGDGNVFATGAVTTTSGGYDVFLTAHTASSGVNLWAADAGGAQEDKGYGVAYGDGKLFATGYFLGTATFGGTTITSSGSKDVFFTALNPSNGAFLWAVKGGGSNGDKGSGVAYGDGKVFAIGEAWSNPATFGGIEVKLLSTNVFLTALNPSNGAYLMAMPVDAADGNGVAYGDSKVFATGGLGAHGDVTFGGTKLTLGKSGSGFLVALVRSTPQAAPQAATVNSANTMSSSLVIAVFLSGAVLFTW